MPLQVQILDNVLKRLDRVVSPMDGCLYCVMYEGKMLIVGVGFEMPVIGAKEPIWYDSAQKLYPTGIDWCGVFTIEKDISKPEETEVREKMKEVAVTNNPLYLRKDLGTGEIKVYYSDGAYLKLCEYDEIKESDFSDNFVYLRLLGMSRITVPIDATHKHVMRQMERLSARVAAGMFFKLGNSDIYLNKYYSSKLENTRIGIVFDKLKKEKDFRYKMEVVNVNAFFPQGPYINEVNKIFKPQIYDYTYPLQFTDSKRQKRFKMIMTLPFDALCIVHRERSIDEIYDLLIDTAERTLFLYESYVLKYIHDPIKVHYLRAHHFFPNELAHPLSLVFSTQLSDESLAHTRRQIHAFLNLPLDKPCFRKANSLTFYSATLISCPLINPHIGVRPSGIRSDRSKSSITKGAYYYYHYMLDGINDDGWGCAYRSLQTVFSWFKLQAYTYNDIPTHEEIQECLVSLGDKPASFKGSKRWIGSTEVAYVLEATLNITSCILNVSSGSDLGSLGTAIYEHFEDHGIPIMIGGGVRAHTIIGIDIDEESGDMKFLVLDPHYCENEDINKIQKNGFVGWKGIDFWDSRSFYNLCLPQRPRCF